MGILLALLVKIVIVVVVEVADEERVSLTREIGKKADLIEWS
jgi:hypothetical protein